MSDHGIVADTPESIELFRLITLKSALKLQSKGITLRRGVNARSIVRKMEGAPKTMDFAKLAEFLEEVIKAQAEKPEALFKPL